MGHRVLGNGAYRAMRRVVFMAGVVHLADMVRHTLSGAVKAAGVDRLAQRLLVHHRFVVLHCHTGRRRVRFRPVNAVEGGYMTFDREMIEFLEQSADLKGQGFQCWLLSINPCGREGPSGE